MTPEDKIILAALESLLYIKFRPTFLALTLHEEDGTIEVVMSSLMFNYLNVNDRVISVFNEIQKAMPALIESNLIVLQAFDSGQMERVLDDLFEEEIRNWL